MSKKIRDAARNQALNMLSPNRLKSAEDVAQAAHVYATKLEELEEAGQAFREAWQAGLDADWTAAELGKLVPIKPPRKQRGKGAASSGEQLQDNVGAGAAARHDSEVTSSVQGTELGVPEDAGAVEHGGERD